MKLNQLAELASELNGAVLASHDMRCNRVEDGKPDCFDAERERPLTKVEKAQGRFRRNVDDFDPSLMCFNCRTFWHTFMAMNFLAYKAVGITPPGM